MGNMFLIAIKTDAYEYKTFKRLFTDNSLKVNRRYLQMNGKGF